METIEIRTPPAFCQYADGGCDQSFERVPSSRAVFLYPSDPPQIAATIEATVERFRITHETFAWHSWKDFQTVGQIIFCSICKHSRFCDAAVVDVTTLNFNLMFEIGFALGLELPVIPIRDTTFIRDRIEFDQLGLLDTIGYLDFQNSTDLAAALLQRLPSDVIPAPPGEPSRAAPLYVLKAPIKTEGEVRLISTIKKSSLNFKAWDPIETPRLSLQDARRSVANSYAVIGHLLSPDRIGARVHNARCAMIAGVGMATGKGVLLLQEGYVPQPIDYRQIVKSYKTPDEIQRRVEPLILQVIRELQGSSVTAVRPPERLLVRLNLGDVAAENEITELRSYFVRTGQFNEAKRGHGRLVVGRKGAGKTAIFFALRDAFAKSRSHLVLDLKPEGHQFTKLREAVLSKLTPGLQEHTLTAFWTYILLCEIAQKVSDSDYSWAHRDPERQVKFDSLIAEYRKHGPADAGDMSERLLRQVDRLTERFGSVGEIGSGGELTEALFRGEIRALHDAVTPYLESKKEVWILVDNLDKGWPTRGATNADILILRSLLDSTRKLQREFTQRGVELRSLVFLRNDIYEHLVRETSDKGKDTAISLDWDDPEVFKEIVRQRISSAAELQGSFDDVWGAVFEMYVGTRSSFYYILDRTLMRPRDLLIFLHRAIEVATNRGHDRVTQEDIKQAEQSFSEDMLLSLTFELRDINQDFADVFYGFLECPMNLSESEVIQILEGTGLLPHEARSVVELLVWFGFLGVKRNDTEEAEFSYQVRYNLAKLMAPIERGKARFIVHPAFWSALSCTGTPGQLGLPALG